MVVFEVKRNAPGAELVFGKGELGFGDGVEPVVVVESLRTTHAEDVEVVSALVEGLDSGTVWGLVLKHVVPS